MKLSETPRNIGEVIKQIKAELPEGTDLSGFERVSRDACCTAPELMYIRWDQLSEVVQRIVGHPESICEQWQVKVLSIFSTLTHDEIIKYLHDTGHIQEIKSESLKLEIIDIGTLDTKGCVHFDGGVCHAPWPEGPFGEGCKLIHTDSCKHYKAPTPRDVVLCPKCNKPAEVQIDIKQGEVVDYCWGCKDCNVIIES